MLAVGGGLSSFNTASLSVHVACFNQKGFKTRLPWCIGWRQGQRTIPVLFHKSSGGLQARESQGWSFPSNDGEIGCLKMRNMCVAKMQHRKLHL